MVRFFMVWVIVSAILGGYAYLASKKEKKEIRKIGWKLAISAVLGLLVSASLMAINNIQGV